AYIERYRALSAIKDIRYVLIFRNHGKEAGASLEHPHSQIAAVPIVPPVILEELAGAGRYYESTGRCVFCDMISQELEYGARVVLDTPRFLALEPYASKMPFETWVLPKAHASSFGELERCQHLELGSVLASVLGALGRGLNDPPYNYILHTAPPSQSCEPYYHWHLEIFPKLTVAAGFEFGMGIYINVTTPEAAAEFLRKCNRDGPAGRRNPGV
ncbi:MAG: galactose-1-phosphate uridylyltransferase, partial [Bacillota bacterium]